MISNIFKKTVLTFKWLFGIKFALKSPTIESFYQNKKENSVGEWYQETIIINRKLEIKSPVKGKIGKIYLDNSTSLITDFNLEIIILPKVIGNDRDFQIKFQKNEGEKLRAGDVIFIIELTKNSENFTKSMISVIVPWQPLLIEKIEKGFISYKNPFSSSKVRNVCSY